MEGVFLGGYAPNSPGGSDSPLNPVFELFELLRKVEELFGEDIKSKNFWRQELYDALIKRGKDE